MGWGKDDFPHFSYKCLFAYTKYKSQQFKDKISLLVP